MAATRALDLDDLARKLACSPDDLAAHIKKLGTQAGAKLVQHRVPRAHSVGTNLALVSLAARPGPLDSKRKPKCLVELGDTIVIAHVLRQLYLGGVDRVLLVVGGRHCDEIARRVANLELCASQLSLEIINLGERYTAGFARSLLVAAPHIGAAEHFLLCTPDHIFDAELIRQMRAAESVQAAAVALVETDPFALQGLPPTAVGVEMLAPDGHGARRIHSIRSKGTRTPSFTGVEAGLYLCGPSFMSALSSIASPQPLAYVTVAQAMQLLAARGSLYASLTGGRSWFAVETTSQLEEASRLIESGSPTDYPENLLMENAHPVPETEESLLISLPPGNLQDSRDAIAGPADASSVGLGPGEVADACSPYTLVHVPSSKSALTTLASQPDTAWASTITERLLGRASAALPSELEEPMLEAPPAACLGVDDFANKLGTSPDKCTATTEVPSSFSVVGGEPRVVRVETGTFDTKEKAFLLDLPQRRVLVLPTPEEPIAWAFGLLPSALPSNVQHVHIEKPREEAELDHVRLTVKKRTPLLGWAILALALVFANSMGPAMVLVSGPRDEPGRHVFLSCVWRCTASGAVFLVAILARPGGRDALAALHSLPLRVKVRMAVAGVMYSINFGAFQTSLQRTSVTHAALLESISCIWLAVAKVFGLARGGPGLSKYETVGVCAGLLGVIVCALDELGDTPDDGSVGKSPRISLVGDLIAMVSGIGASGYIYMAEGLRYDVDFSVLYLCLLSTFLCVSLLGAFTVDRERPTLAMDTEAGLLGWMASGERLFAQLYIAICCDLFGNLGFIAVLKYLPALSVTAAMLLGPIVATVEGLAFGVTSMPGIYTVCGAAAAMFGSACILYEQLGTHSETVYLRT